MDSAANHDIPYPRCLWHSLFYKQLMHRSHMPVITFREQADMRMEACIKCGTRHSIFSLKKQVQSVMDLLQFLCNAHRKPDHVLVKNRFADINIKASTVLQIIGNVCLRCFKSVAIPTLFQRDMQREPEYRFRQANPLFSRLQIPLIAVSSFSGRMAHAHISSLIYVPVSSGVFLPSDPSARPLHTRSPGSRSR